MERRLAAIVAADVVGYSRLMREDEDGTLEDLKRLRQSVVDPALEPRGGRVAKLMGDGILVEFPSAVEAVRAAMEIQNAMANQPSAAKIIFRVGINLGDIVVEDGDIFGDGVNVAARLESEAPPGGICISGGVHEQVRDRIQDEFEDLGELTLKNIDRPVRAWSWSPSFEPASTNIKQTGELKRISDKPTIAVLPFNVFSSDPDTEYLADGMVEDIITTLSKVPDLLVTARNSTFVYKGKAVDIRRAGRDLGVCYILEGSVREIGKRVRVTAQLVDAETGGHIWADSFDGSVSDVFELIDDISLRILKELEVHLIGGEQMKAYAQGKWTIRAYENFRIGRQLYFRFTRRTNAEARQRCKAALEECPDWATACCMLAWTHADDARWGWSSDREADLKAALAFFDQAISLDLEFPFSWGGKAYTEMLIGDYDHAIELAKKTVSLGPSSADSLHPAAMVMNYCGRPEDALGFAKHANRSTPVPQSNILTELGHAHLLVQEPARAIAPLRHALAISPFWISARCLLIWALDGMGDLDGAKAMSAELIDQAPRFNLHRWAPTQPYRDHLVLKDQVAALRRASIPDGKP